MIARTAVAELLLVLLAACGVPERPAAPASSSTPPASSVVVAPIAVASDASVAIADASSSSSTLNVATGPEPKLEVRPSDVIVTGGLGYADDRYARPNDPKPGDKVEIVRIHCIARGKPDEQKQYTCTGASKATSPDGEVFARRVRQCFDVKERPGTASEAASVGASLAANKYVDVPRGQLYALETKYVQKQPEMRGVPCKASPHQPCDPVTVPTGRMVDVSETIAQAIGPNRVDAGNPYYAWPLDWIDITPMPSSIEGQSHVVRVAMLFDRAVEAVRSKDRARIAAAVKALDDEVHGFEDRSLQPIAMKVSGNLETLRAIAAGRATVGDACKR